MSFYWLDFHLNRYYNFYRFSIIGAACVRRLRTSNELEWELLFVPFHFWSGANDGNTRTNWQTPKVFAQIIHVWRLLLGINCSKPSRLNCKELVGSLEWDSLVRFSFVLLNSIGIFSKTRRLYLQFIGSSVNEKRKCYDFHRNIQQTNIHWPIDSFRC